MLKREIENALLEPHQKMVREDGKLNKVKSGKKLNVTSESEDGKKGPVLLPQPKVLDWMG